jgi:RNA polymerase sigma-70 factor (ECF subfamily)
VPATQLTSDDRRLLAEEEAELVGRLAAGDRGEPLAELYDRYGTRVYRIGLALLGDVGLAEDLVQETFLRLWRSAGRFDARRGAVSTFVFTLARRAAVDLWRRNGARPASVAEVAEDDPAAEEAFDRLVLGLWVREALDTLPLHQRRVLELQYHADLTQSQVAVLLDLPLGTVKTRTLRALRALARVLRERDLVA